MRLSFLLHSCLIGVFLLLTSISYGQSILGHFSAGQVVDGKLVNDDLVLVYPRSSSSINTLWMQVDVSKNAAFIELNDASRQKLLEILEAYYQLNDVIEIPKELPAKQDIGRFTTRCAFFLEPGKFKMDSYQDIVVFMKFAKSGRKSMGIYVGKVQSDKDKTVSFEVANLWLSVDEVRELYYEISDRNVQRYLNSRNKTLDPTIIDMLDGDNEDK